LAIARKSRTSAGSGGRSFRVREAIEITGRIRGGDRAGARRRAGELNEALDIGEWRDAMGQRLSGGVKRLVGFAVVTVWPGRLVILDEPTNDVDPLRRWLLWDQIRALGERGSAVLLVTHKQPGPWPAARPPLGFSAVATETSRATEGHRRPGRTALGGWRPSAAKFALKKAGGPEFKVSTLEGLWWADDMTKFLTGDKSEWNWTMMIRQPDAVTDDLLAHLAEDVAAKKSMPAARQLRLTSFEEGAAAQVLHIGSCAAEAPTIARLHEFIREQGFTFDGHRHKHHEIYLGDPRRSAPEKLRTIIRQPYATS
jgi:hypothetical protein